MTRLLFDREGKLAAAWPASARMHRSRCRSSRFPNVPSPRSATGSPCLPTLPRIRLIIVGAGHVGQGVASLAAQANFDVWVIDDRRQYANAERFPSAQQIIVGAIDEVLPSLEVTAQTYALIVTRGHGHDQQALFHLAPTPAPYVGLIGSRRKIRMIFESLRELGISESALARVNAPRRVRHRVADRARDRDQYRCRADCPEEHRHQARRRRLRSVRAGLGARPRMIAAIVPAAGRSERMGRRS